ncbi:hypothetical protein [Streptomyces albus]|uniref:hypothetical protein n=1 Tax=Streptomyces sp. NRRL F-5917 TaxID=1463873 RepID=UPI0004BE6FA1|nr:hypothetical protein [Streptomyces sp. NRRL F-5917]
MTRTRVPLVPLTGDEGGDDGEGHGPGDEGEGDGSDDGDSAGPVRDGAGPGDGSEPGDGSDSRDIGDSAAGMPRPVGRRPGPGPRRWAVSSGRCNTWLC